LGSILLIGLQLTRDTRQRLAETAATNERNQAAILRLLDEIADLADGDLTAEATVTEDFTGAIADSINYSIDQLRALVETINHTALQVAKAAQETQSTAMHLAEASEHQAQEIAGRSEEHTSELQSRENLVCRLLLEKKKRKNGRDLLRVDLNTANVYGLR